MKLIQSTCHFFQLSFPLALFSFCLFFFNSFCRWELVKTTTSPANTRCGKMHQPLTLEGKEQLQRILKGESIEVTAQMATIIRDYGANKHFMFPMYEAKLDYTCKLPSSHSPQSDILIKKKTCIPNIYLTQEGQGRKGKGSI